MAVAVKTTFSSGINIVVGGGADSGQVNILKQKPWCNAIKCFLETRIYILYMLIYIYVIYICYI